MSFVIGFFIAILVGWLIIKLIGLAIKLVGSIILGIVKLIDAIFGNLNE